MPEQKSQVGDTPSVNIPESFYFGQDLPWSDDLVAVRLYVELPFWLMVDPGTVTIENHGYPFRLLISRPHIEVFFGEILDLRRTLAWRGPTPLTGWRPSEELVHVAQETKSGFMQRPCKTVVRLESRGLKEAFDITDDNELPRVEAQKRAYWASLCEAHLPVINELVQRYRLLTYEYFTYE